MSQSLTTVIRSDAFVVASLQFVQNGCHIVLDRTVKNKNKFNIYIFKKIMKSDSAKEIEKL